MKIRTRVPAVALLAACFVAFAFPPAVLAQSGTGAVVGVVQSADGVPIPGAVVTLSGNGTQRTTTADKKGLFGISGLSGGTYTVRADAKGYDSLSGRTVDVPPGGGAQLSLSMARSTTSLTVIGQVRANGQQTVSTSSAPTVDVNTQAYADIGYTRVSDVLDNEISTTLIHPLGGSPLLPTSVALRGPDPTETLVDVDGHAVNNGNTGDFDLSLLDPADFSAVQLVYGISPSSLVGPNTIDGAINIRTLEPTTDAHGVLRLSTGSWNAFAATLDATGTADRLGYAFSLHRTTTGGEVNENVIDADSGQQQFVGSAVQGSTALGKLRYSFGSGSGYIGLTFHDQSYYKDYSAALTSIPPPGGSSSSDDDILRTRDADTGDDTSGLPVVDSFAGTYTLGHNAAYGLDLQVPLGRPDAAGIAKTTALLRWMTSDASQSVFGPGADTDPYLYNNKDLIGDGIFEIDQRLPNGSLTLQLNLHNENLDTDFVPGIVNDESVARRPLDDSSEPTPAPAPTAASLDLGQTERSAVLRWTEDPTSYLHFALAAYYSNYSTFGTSFDPRAGFVWTPNASTAVRASVGTTFQIPQLPELFVPPVLPPPVGGYINIGNPALQPDRATDYGLGFEHYFATGNYRTHVSLDLYRTNLRNPATTLVPPLSNNPDCGNSSADAILRTKAAPVEPCPLSFPVNAGNAVYQGFELRADRQLAAYTTLRAGYSVNSAYLTAVPPAVQDGTLVIGEQALGLPLQKGTLSIDRRPPLGLEYGAALIYQGFYNGYDQPKFATLSAMLGYRYQKYEVNLAATNLTNVYAYKFTMENAGIPYGGCCGTGPIPTDAYAMQGTQFTLTVARRY
jgi:outer membrane receptor protein involved in Fe transport